MMQRGLTPAGKASRLFSAPWILQSQAIRHMRRSRHRKRPVREDLDIPSNLARKIETAHAKPDCLCKTHRIVRAAPLRVRLASSRGDPDLVRALLCPSGVPTAQRRDRDLVRVEPVLRGRAAPLSLFVADRIPLGVAGNDGFAGGVEARVRLGRESQPVHEDPRHVVQEIRLLKVRPPANNAVEP